MHTVFLSLGSNLGNKQKNIQHAYLKIEKLIGKIVSRSAFYMSAPLGFDSDNEFINTVCEVHTYLKPENLLAATVLIEKELGRHLKSQNGQHFDRTMDIDILLYDNLIIRDEHLKIPHPRFHERDFVLTPFAEIAPNIIHPLFFKTILQLKDELREN